LETLQDKMLLTIIYA